MYFSQPSQPEPPTTPPNTPITIGDVKYNLNLSQIPYLSSFAAFQAKSHTQATELVHSPIPLFDTALRGIQAGYRQCFRSLPPALSQHHVLCETYEFLGINILGDQHIDGIFTDLKTCKTDYELEDEYYRAVKGNKAKARDAAFKVLYLMLLGDFENENKDSVKAFNAVLFVVSHPGTFKWRTRTVVRAAYEERFVVSAKQMVRLDQWLGGDTEDDVEYDVTTEEDEDEVESDGYYYYDSDYS
jgi:hypothetical protein